MFDTQDLLSEINIYNKYARYLDDKNRRETWHEICDRVMMMHMDKYPKITDEIAKAFEFVREKKILPSMRSLQFAGRPIELNPVRLYNCSYTAIDTYKAFSEIMFLLLSGTGVGFSVQLHHVAQLPVIKKATRMIRYKIGDSIEGWSNAVDKLIRANFGLTDTYPNFDYRDIRPRGTTLKTSGSKAPGSEPLKLCLENIEKIFASKKNSEKLYPIEVHDIICHLSEAVLSGGIRRSSIVSLFSKNDQGMLNAKNGNWWETNIQRVRAHNSIVLHRETTTKEEFFELWKTIQESRCGEPQIFFTNDLEIGMSPGTEISLSNNGLCNLIEINTGNITSQIDLNDRMKAGAFIGTLQSGYVDFHYLKDAWHQRAKQDALLGVSLTGIGDGLIFDYNLREAAQNVINENNRVAKLIGINPSIRSTTIKPSNNSSIVLKTSSGIYPRHAPYYWRRLRIGKVGALYEYLSIQAPYMLENDIYNPHEAIIKVPVVSPENALFKT
ncbi:MAG: hypothetical protein ACRCV0_06475, partial [Brevinema sp.]